MDWDDRACGSWGASMRAGAGYAAIGHAMIEGFGVCLVSAGPSATNAVSACAAAWTDSVPVLFISGQARRSTLIGKTKLRSFGAQEIDIVAMAEPVTKWAYQPMEGKACTEALELMIEKCRAGRPGPCWLSVPQDVSGEEC